MAFATFTFNLDSANPSGVGFGIPMLPSPNADAAFLGDRARSYKSASAIAVDFPSKTGPEYLWGAAIFAQDKHPETVIIGRLANKPTMVYEMSALAVTPGATYPIDVDGDGVTSTALAVTLPATNITVSAVTNGDDTFTAVAHGLTTGEGPHRLTNSGGALPTGSAVDTDYWFIAATVDAFKIATSKANALAGTAINITSDGTGVHTVNRTSNDVLMALIKDRGNAVVGKNYTITQVTGAGETDALLWTGTAPGEWFSPAIDPRQLVAAQVYVDPGFTDDLDAIQVASQDWYCVHNVFNSKAIVLAIAAWVEAANGDADNPTPHYYEAETSNTLSATATVGGAGNDIGDSLKALGYTRTHCHYSRRPQRMFAGRTTGRLYGLDPGQVDFVYKQLAGIELDNTLTDTHRVNLDAKRMSYLKREKGLALTAGGKMTSGEWWDVTRNLDALRDQVAVELVKIRANNDVLTMTDGGIASLESGLRTVVVSNTIIPGIRDKAIIADTPAPTYVIPRAADISSGDRTARRAGPLSCQFRLAGSINEVDVIFNVTQ